MSEPRNYRDDPAPAPADVTVRRDRLLGGGDEVWQPGDPDLAARLADELAALGLPSRPGGGREPAPAAGLPRVPPGVRADLRPSSVGLGLGNLVTFGRQGLFTPDNTSHALAMGWAAAECFAAEDPRPRLGGASTGAVRCASSSRTDRREDARRSGTR